MNYIGYARVSTTGQDLETQIARLKKSGCNKVYKEKESGAGLDHRHELEKALDYIREDEALVVTKLDRLARSVFDLHKISSRLMEKGAGLIILDQSLDTTQPEGRLLFTMLGAVAEFERDLIMARTEEGRKKAMAAGVKFGRSKAISEKACQEFLDDAKAWTGSMAELARKHKISRATAYRYIQSIPSFTLK